MATAAHPWASLPAMRWIATEGVQAGLGVEDVVARAEEHLHRYGGQRGFWLHQARSAVGGLDAADPRVADRAALRLAFEAALAEDRPSLAWPTNPAGKAFEERWTAAYAPARDAAADSTRGELRRAAKGREQWSRSLVRFVEGEVDRAEQQEWEETEMNASAHGVVAHELESPEAAAVWRQRMLEAGRQRVEIERQLAELDALEPKVVERSAVTAAAIDEMEERDLERGRDAGDGMGF